MRAMNERLRAHIEQLTRELAAAKVDSGYRCYDCEALRTDLRQTQQALTKLPTILQHRPRG
jgi:hypothetical protein